MSNSQGLRNTRLTNFLLSTAWTKKSELWRTTDLFPPVVPQLTLKAIAGNSGGGGGNNPLANSFALGYTPAVGDLLLIFAGWAQSVNQLFQPGDNIPSQPMGLQVNDGGINTYTPIAYQEQFPRYLGSASSAIATGIFACLATNTTNIPTIFATSNTIFDDSASTAFTAQSNFYTFFYALSPGRMPVKMYDFYSLTQAISLPPFAVNTGRFCILGNYHNGGTLVTNLNFRNDFLFETSPFVAKGFVQPTANAGASSVPLWQGSVVRI